MIDAELIADLKVSTSMIFGTCLLESLEGSRVVEEVAKVFVKDSSCQWWWESLSKPYSSIHYGTIDPLPIIQEFIEESGSCCYLVVTDDASPPWPVVSGFLTQLFDVIRQTRYFEFFIVNSVFSRVVFDTHHNCLICAINTNS